MAEAVPRPIRYRRSVLRGQHLPLYTSGFRGVRAFGSYPVRCWLPANTGDRHGPDAGTHYIHQERFDYVRSGVYVPADDLTDPAPATSFAHLDATTVLNRAISEKGIYPAVDPLDSTSRLLDPQIVGEEHYAVAPTFSRFCSATNRFRISSRFWAWTNCQKTTN